MPMHSAELLAPQWNSTLCLQQRSGLCHHVLPFRLSLRRCSVSTSSDGRSHSGARPYLCSQLTLSPALSTESCQMVQPYHKVPSNLQRPLQLAEAEEDRATVVERRHHHPQDHQARQVRLKGARTAIQQLQALQRVDSVQRLVLGTVTRVLVVAAARVQVSAPAPVQDLTPIQSLLLKEKRELKRLFWACPRLWRLVWRPRSF